MGTTIDLTAQKLDRMLKENTGRHLLDSGDHYGRHWQANQGTDFEKEPEAILEIWHPKGESISFDFSVTLSVYHWLKDHLEYNPELDERYREFCEENEVALDLCSATEFVDSLDGKGIYGEGGPVTVNTYNGEDLLSQTIQYVYWTDEDGDNPRVLLQIHGGCDVRGGYTAPVVFDVADYDGTAIFDNARATISCEGCCRHWDTDDGCHWVPDWEHTVEANQRQQLQDYPTTNEPPDYLVEDPNQLTLPTVLPKRPRPDTGKIWIDEDKKAHCPTCGGTLEAWFWPAG